MEELYKRQCGSMALRVAHVVLQLNSYILSHALEEPIPELRSCVKVEVAVLGSHP